jgi:hypothetical protein
MLGVAILMLPDEYASWSAPVKVRVTALPLSSSPEPLNVSPEFIPIGLPVVLPVFEDQVAVAPPNTSIVPAYAETDARDPHNADKPTFVNLFIFYIFSLS